MPLYEYECRQCHRRTEKIQKFSDPELTVCPHCGGALERTITAPAVQFKGGGWFNDGYASKKPDAPGGETKSESKAGESAPAKAESASAPTPSAPAAPAAPTSTTSGS